MSTDQGLTTLELLRPVPRLEAAKQRGVSVRTLDSQFRGQYVAVSERRKALRLYQVLGLPDPRLPAQPQTVAPKEAAKRHVYGVAAQRIGRPHSVRVAATME
jgi:hypothetical protein